MRTTRDSQKFRHLGLLAVNAVLLGVLGLVTLNPAAKAQQTRVPGAYIMVSGGANGSASDLVYIMDVRNQELIALSFDPNNNTLLGVDYRNVGADSAQSIGTQGR